jgi:DNA-binding NarL/FixJ family response regulator
MEINTDIITVLTKDFSFVKTTIENSNIDNIAKSLNTLAVTLNQCAKSISDMKSDNGLNTLFIPFFNSGQILQEIKELSEDVIVLSGIDQSSDEFNAIRQNAWIRHQKIIVGESHKAMAENFTQQFVEMFIAANPRNPLLNLKQEPIIDNIEIRYEKFVEMANKGLTMKDIAVVFNLSVPSIYLIRSQIKDRLLADSAVNKKAPAMKFNGKRKTATG